MAKKQPKEGEPKSYDYAAEQDIELTPPEEEKPETVDKMQFDALNDRYLRILADFENFKRRNAESGRKMYLEGKLDMIESILPTLDFLDMAIAAQKDEGQRQGVELVKKAFLDVLSKEGVTEYDPTGEEFDPKLHEAVMSSESEGNEGKVIAVMKKGYRHESKVLRHPMVVVGK